MTHAIFALIGDDALPVSDPVTFQASRGSRIVGITKPLHIRTVYRWLHQRAPPFKRLALRTQCPNSSSGFATERASRTVRLVERSTC